MIMPPGRLPKSGHVQIAPVAKSLMRTMEEAFSTSFSDVTVYRLKSTPGLANDADVCGCATLDRIGIASALLDRGGPLLENVLSHELAHICQ